MDKNFKELQDLYLILENLEEQKANVNKMHLVHSVAEENNNLHEVSAKALYKLLHPVHGPFANSQEIHSAFNQFKDKIMQEIDVLIEKVKHQIALFTVSKSETHEEATI